MLLSLIRCGSGVSRGHVLWLCDVCLIPNTGKVLNLKNDPWYNGYTALIKKPDAASLDGHNIGQKVISLMELILSSQNQTTNINQQVFQSKSGSSLDNVGTTPTYSNFNNKKQRFSLRRKLQGTLLKMDTPLTWNKAIKLCGTGIATSHLDYTKMLS